MSIPIKDLGAIGLIKDMLAHQLPPNAWSDGKNIRFVDGYVERMPGNTPIYGTPGTTPNWLLPVPGLTDYYWVYCSLTKAYMVDSAQVHTDVTRLLGNYTGNLDINWNGGLINGIPVINNGVDDPQMQNPGTPATKFIKLTAWPASTTVRCMRPFKQYLFGMDWTESGTRYQHKVRWSSQAAAGAVPATWDITDATQDAGQATLPDSGGFALDSLPLRDVNIVYKENEVWGFQYVGGAQVFRGYRIVGQAGMLTRDCAVPFYSGGLKHAVLGNDDLFVHDGNTAQSIADSRLRKWFFAQISAANFERCFVVANYPAKQIWFCIVPEGQSLATLALPWNWKTGTFSPLRELTGIRYAAAGLVNDAVTGISWDSDSGVWNADTTIWDERAYGQPAQKLILPYQTPSLQYADQGQQFAGSAYTSTIERIGLPFSKVDKQGLPEADVNTRKLMTELWPRFEAPAGTSIDIYCGAQEEVNDPVTWKGPFTFIVGQHKKINPLVSGRFLAVRFSSSANAGWKLHEYAYDVNIVGRYD